MLSVVLVNGTWGVLFGSCKIGDSTIPGRLFEDKSCHIIYESEYLGHLIRPKI